MTDAQSILVEEIPDSIDPAFQLRGEEKSSKIFEECGFSWGCFI